MTADQSRFETLIEILVSPMQVLENAWIQLLTERTVDDAIGTQLDVLGRIVGQVRGGLVDDDYRRYIRARVATNRSTGKREELINIARLVLNDPTANVVIHSQAVATCYVRVGDGVAVPPAVETALFTFLSQAVGCAIRLILQTNSYAPGLRFKFSGGGKAAAPGFDSTVTPGIGGHLASVRG